MQQKIQRKAFVLTLFKIIIYFYIAFQNINFEKTFNVFL